MNRFLLSAIVLASCSLATAQKSDRENLEFNNTHLPAKLIYDQIKTYSYRYTVFGGDPSQLTTTELSGMSYQFKSFEGADQSSSDMRINYTVGPFTFVEEKTESRKVDEEVNKQKVSVTKYKRVYKYKYPIRVEVVNAKNNVRLYVNEYPAGNIFPIEGYEFNTESEAISYFEKTRNESLKANITSHVKSFFKSINPVLADQYDFYPANTFLNVFQFKKWERDDEYNLHVAHLKQVMKNMTAGEHPALAKEKLKDDIAYFQQFEGVFNPKDKKQDILYFGNYMNLATIFFCLDDMTQAGYYIAKLDSVNEKEGMTSILKNHINRTNNRMAKHFLSTTHLDYNPVRDFRLADKKFTSDALSAAENLVNNMGQEGVAKANDLVKLANGTSMKGKVIYYAESNSIKLHPSHKPDSAVILNPENTLAFNIDSVDYISAKHRLSGTVVKQFLKVSYKSNKIVLVTLLNQNLTEQAAFGTIRPNEELVTFWGGFGLKKSLGNYFVDCVTVSQKAKDGEYGGAVSAEVKKYIKMCEDYTNECGNKTASSNPQ
jgi:hypothetical protein